MQDMIFGVFEEYIIHQHQSKMPKIDGDIQLQMNKRIKPN